MCIYVSAFMCVCILYTDYIGMISLRSISIIIFYDKQLDFQISNNFKLFVCFLTGCLTFVFTAH